MKELNLTQGNVPKVLLQFAVPFLIANILQALYGGADLFVVGQYDDWQVWRTVATAVRHCKTITGIILGITTGTTVLIAIATGSKDNRQVASHRIVRVVAHGRGCTNLDNTSQRSRMETSDPRSFDTKLYFVCHWYSLWIQRCMWYSHGRSKIVLDVLDFILVGYFHLGATERLCDNGYWLSWSKHRHVTA